MILMIWRKTVKMSDKFEPLKSQVMTGYMISKARTKGQKYIERALSCLEQAQDDTNDDLGREAVQNVDLGSARKKMYKAMAALEVLEEAHKELSEIMQDLGYRRLTSHDFSDIGVSRR